MKQNNNQPSPYQKKLRNPCEGWTYSEVETQQKHALGW